jgi:hypothetical protein
LNNSEDNETAVDMYLKSVAYNYQNDKTNAQKYLDAELARDKNVVYKARFKSRFRRLTLK